MKLVSAGINTYASDGARVMDVVLAADTTPATLPTTGEGIDGLNDTDLFAPLSVLYVVGTSDVYVADESGIFRKQ